MKMSITSILVDGVSRGVELFYLNEQLPQGAGIYLLFTQEDLSRKTSSMSFDPIYIGQADNMAELSYDNFPQDKLRGCPACFLILKGVVISSHETNRFS